MYSRILTSAINNRLNKGKALLITGPRQVGKTTLIKNYLADKEYLFLDGDDPKTRIILSNATTEELKKIIGEYLYVFIDEAQRIENIGLTMKIITDQFKNVQLIASGSSAFELNNQINEPLTGRKWEMNLFPISWEEIVLSKGEINAQQQLEQLLIYGTYPDVLNNNGDEREIITQLADSYLYKDLLNYQGIRKSDVLEKILRALAFQVGNEVSFNEIAKLVGIDKNTVQNYVSILESAYIIFTLNSFSRNLRNEIKMNRKIYFYDNGIRNAIIQNFNPIQLRNDVGALWENFLISERMKFNHYHKTYAKGYFWRTVQQQEIDYIEEKDGKITGFEFKWNSKAKAKIPSSFKVAYQAEVEIIHPENFNTFIG